MHEHETPSLLKDVPGHLFSFEEKVFGLMTLSQLLCDLGGAAGMLMLTASLSLSLRLVVGLVLALPLLVLVHGKVQDDPLLPFLARVGRQLFLPRLTTWQSGPREKGEPPAIQTTWIPFDSLEGGIAGYSESGDAQA